MKYTKLLAASICAVTILSGCGDSKELATIDGSDISQAEFQAYLKFKRIPEQDQARVQRALDDFIQREALAAAIENSERLDTELMQAELQEFRRQMLIGRYFEDYLKDTVSDDAVRNYYASNAEQYQARSVHAAHILVRVEANLSETERQAKLSTAHEAYSRLQTGADFAEVAKTYSEDAVSAAKGGDLGWLKEGAVSPEFSQRLFALQPGEVTEPFLTPFGFHVVKLIEGPQVVKRPVEAVEGDIRYQLRNEAKLAETQRLLESVKISRKASDAAKDKQ